MPARPMREVFLSLRLAYELTQEQVAARSSGLFDRVLANKVETGRNKGSSDRIHAGIANAFGLTRDELAAYVSGRASLVDTIRARETRLRTQIRKAKGAEADTLRAQLAEAHAVAKRVDHAA